MSARALKRRLIQAQRINAVKEGRSERERRAAFLAQQEAEERANAARERQKEADKTHAEARSAFFEHHGDPQAEIWMIANEMRAEKAASEQRIAAGDLSLATDTAIEARRAHERLRERGGMIDRRVIGLGRDLARIAQDRDDEEMQEQRR